ncbi:MAG: hypothetical protein LQ339_008256 [Xanthoria mediterranea]|nr:MAG: hypothetical protein LQ339_008256 [Xanthoria mediterranea]
MHILSLLALLSALPSVISTSPSLPLQIVTIHSLPSTPALSSPAKPLATLTFSPQHPHLSKISSYAPPRLNSGDEEKLLQIGICYDGTKDCRTTAARAKSFHPPYQGRFRIVVTNDGELLSVSWSSWLPSPSSMTMAVKDDEKRYQEGSRGDFDVVVQSQAPGVWADKPATKVKGKAASGKTEEGKGKEGEEEEEVDERSFLQKYWWVMLAVTVFAMAGGGADK